MLKRQLPKLLQYTDYLRQIKIIEENIKCYVVKAFFLDWTVITLSTLHITNKVLKITIIK